MKTFLGRDGHIALSRQSGQNNPELGDPIPQKTASDLVEWILEEEAVPPMGDREEKEANETERRFG